MPNQSGIAFLPQQQAVGRQAIATGAARFLIVLFNGLRQREMDHGAHRRLIDAQSESDRADEDTNFVRHPAFLVGTTLVFLHLAVIGNGWNSLLLQEINRLFHASDSGRIHN